MLAYLVGLVYMHHLFEQVLATLLVYFVSSDHGDGFHGSIASYIQALLEHRRHLQVLPHTEHFCFRWRAVELDIHARLLPLLVVFIGGPAEGLQWVFGVSHVDSLRQSVRAQVEGGVHTGAGMTRHSQACTAHFTPKQSDRDPTGHSHARKTKQVQTAW